MNSFTDELQWRELLFQKTPGAEKALNTPNVIYWGIDPTGDSQHIGNFMGVAFLKRALQYGHKVIVLAGGGTAMIGDPGGKDAERPILPKEVIEVNKEKIKQQFSKFFEINGKNVIMVDNADWLEKEKLIDFLRDAGKYISVNSMMDKESVKARITRQEGISYAEFSYQLLQAFDYLQLYEKYDCTIQIGGSDQWGNIVQGVELIRKKLGKEAHAVSFPLIVNPKTGKKFGKTEQGTSIWLNPEKTHPFDFYQFLVNVEDELAPQLMKYFSFKSRGDIETLIKQWEQDKGSRLLQKELAFELTSLVHGSEIAEQSKHVAQILFYKSEDSLTKENLEFIITALPHRTIHSADEFNFEQSLVDLRLVSSKGEARRLMQQNGVKSELFFNKYYLLKKGKRDYGIVEIKN